MLHPSIYINNQAYPFGSTAEGAKLIQQLKIDIAKVRNYEREELKRYAYCIAAGAAVAAGIEFPFTVDQFIAGCEYDWKKKTITAIKSALKNDQSTGSKKAQKAYGNEAPEKTQTIEKNN